MPSTWSWLNDSKTIALVSLRNDWSYEDLGAYTNDFWPQMAQQPHTVNVVVDLRQGGLLPMQPMVSLIWLAKHRPKNAGRVIFVVKRALGLAIVRALQSTMQRLYPQFHISGALTLEEAVQLLTPAGSDETIEVRASSLAEAGSQSPSGFPQ
jgi:hypothetical protein